MDMGDRDRDKKGVNDCDYLQVFRPGLLMSIKNGRFCDTNVIQKVRGQPGDLAANSGVRDRILLPATPQ
jgi:hypothetical protein